MTFLLGLIIGGLVVDMVYGRRLKAYASRLDDVASVLITRIGRLQITWVKAVEGITGPNPESAAEEMVEAAREYGETLRELVRITRAGLGV